MPKWHTRSLQGGHWNPTFPPPCPHRIPSLPPPSPFRGLKCAILAQFGVSGALGSGWGVRGFRTSDLN